MKSILHFTTYCFIKKIEIFFRYNYTSHNPLSITTNQSNMYTIIGLNIKSVIDNSYKIDNLNSNRILHNKEKKNGITKNHTFIKYILYITFEDAYYAIHLSDCHIASFGGRLCSMGDMHINPVDYEEAQKNITHVPLTPLVIKGFELNKWDNDDVTVYLDNDLNTRVFSFSLNGNDEKTPCGYIYVNTELFM